MKFYIGFAIVALLVAVNCLGDHEAHSLESNSVPDKPSSEVSEQHAKTARVVARRAATCYTLNSHYHAASGTQTFTRLIATGYSYLCSWWWGRRCRV